VSLQKAATVRVRRDDAGMTEDVVRKLLLERDLAWGPTGRVEVRRITMAPNAGAGRHRHNGPVVGTIERGSVLFQVEGGEPVVLGAGEGFYEPADEIIEHFDATDEGVVFTAVFLLHPGEAGELEALEG
jgi:quercetin dioxygenase-like cupin family protein